MGFTALSAANTRRLFRRLGDPCTVTPQDGNPIETFGVLEKRTPVIGDLGQMLDERPSIELLAEDVGRARRAEVSINGQVFDLDQPVPLGGLHALGADDGLIVRYYLRERRDG